MNLSIIEENQSKRNVIQWITLAPSLILSNHQSVTNKDGKLHPVTRLDALFRWSLPYNNGLLEGGAKY